MRVVTDNGTRCADGPLLRGIRDLPRRGLSQVQGRQAGATFRHAIRPLLNGIRRQNYGAVQADLGQAGVSRSERAGSEFNVDELTDPAVPFQHQEPECSCVRPTTP